jgi:putative Mn2+ efflux pump MntP
MLHVRPGEWPAVSYWEITLLSVVLAIDATSVAAAVSPACCRRWGPWRLAGAFGIFQALMPVLGGVAGVWLLTCVGDYDHWVAFGLLELIGGKILVDAWLAWRRGESAEGQKTRGSDPSWGWSLLGLAVATSIDAFGAGVALATRRANMWVAAPTIGLVCAVLTLAGARLGARASRFLGRWAEVAGGLVLMGLGVKMLVWE